MDLARLLSYELSLSLVGWAAAHVAVTAQLARRGSWRRAAIALVVPPLAPWWAWQAGLKKTTWTWGAALALYAAGLTVAVVFTGP
jgi:hypothetical protein